MVNYRKPRAPAIASRPRKGETAPKVDKKALNKAINAIAKSIEKGLTQNDAARANGVNPRTFESWMEKARAGKPGYEGVEEKISDARCKGQLALADTIIKHSKNDWRAAAWILERRHPETWGKTNEVRLSGNVDLAVGKLSDAELEEQIKATEAEILELEQSKSGEWSTPRE